MVRRLRFAIAAVSAATLLVIALVATGLTSGSSAAAPHRIAVQPPPVAAASHADDAAVVPTDDTTTSTTPVTAPLTTAPRPTVPATVPPTTSAAAPRPTTAPVVRPVVAAPANVPAAVSGGNANDFSLIGYRWNPCRAITVHSSGPEVAAIVAELASITGLRLQMVGGTANITVTWGDVPPGGEIGLTAWRAASGWLTQAGVVISPQAQPYLATVLRHELGHALGLGHAPRSNEVMYGTVGHNSPTDYQVGDIAGLRAIGAAAGGC